jgi:hypothetical protein
VVDIENAARNGPRCDECTRFLDIELWVFDGCDVTLVHVCPDHGPVAVSRPLD